MTNFPDSELILHPDGSIYHLNLHPDDISPIIITVGDPQRVPLVSKHFDEIEVQKSKREFVTHTGRVGNQRLTVLSTGIGTGNIDIVMNELDALVNIDLENRMEKEVKTQLTFIRIGTTGSLQAELAVDEKLVSTFGLGLDGLLHFYQQTQAEDSVALLRELEQYFSGSKAFPIPLYLSAGTTSLIENVAGSFHHGITLTAPGFYAPQIRHLRLAGVFSDIHLNHLTNFRWKDLKITNMEMETASIYGFAQLLGHRAISFNAVLANRINHTFSKKPKETVENLIVDVIEWIDRGMK